MEVALLICTSIIGWWLTWTALYHFKNKKGSVGPEKTPKEFLDTSEPTLTELRDDEPEVAEPLPDAAPQTNKKAKKRRKILKPASTSVAVYAVPLEEVVEDSGNVFEGSEDEQSPSAVVEECCDDVCWQLVEAGGKVKVKKEAVPELAKPDVLISKNKVSRDDATLSTSADDSDKTDSSVMPTPTIPKEAVDITLQRKKLAASKTRKAPRTATKGSDAASPTESHCQLDALSRFQTSNITTPEIPAKLLRVAPSGKTSINATKNNAVVTTLAVAPAALRAQTLPQVLLHAPLQAVPQTELQGVPAVCKAARGEARKESSGKRDRKRGETKRRTKKEKALESDTPTGPSNAPTARPELQVLTLEEKAAKEAFDKLTWAERVRLSVSPEKKPDEAGEVSAADCASCPKLLSHRAAESKGDSCRVASPDSLQQAPALKASRCPLSLLDSDDDDTEPEPRASRCRPASESLGVSGGSRYRGSTSAAPKDPLHVGASGESSFRSESSKLDTGPRMLGECVRWGTQGFGFVRTELNEHLFVHSDDVRCDERGQRCLQLGQLVWFRRGLGNRQGRGNAVQVVQVDDDSAWSIRKADRKGIPRSRLRYEIDGDISVLKEGEVEGAHQCEFGSFSSHQHDQQFPAACIQEAWPEQCLDLCVDGTGLDGTPCMGEDYPVEMLPPGSWHSEASLAPPMLGYVMIAPMLESSQDTSDSMILPDHASCYMPTCMQHDVWPTGVTEPQWTMDIESSPFAFEFEMMGNGMSVHQPQAQQKDSWDQEWGTVPGHSTHFQGERQDEDTSDCFAIRKAKGSLQSRFRFYQQQQQQKWASMTFSPSSVVAG